MRQGSSFFLKNCYSLKLNCNEEKFAHICSEKMAQKVNQLFMKRKNTFGRTFIGIFVRA